MQDWTVNERADTNTFLTLKDIWQILSTEEKEIVLKKQAGSGRHDVWAYIQHWEQWLRRRYVEVKGYKLPELPKRPKNAFKFYFESRMRQRDADDPEKGFGKIIYQDWTNLDEKRRSKYIEMASTE